MHSGGETYHLPLQYAAGSQYEPCDVDIYSPCRRRRLASCEQPLEQNFLKSHTALGIIRPLGQARLISRLQYSQSLILGLVVLLSRMVVVGADPRFEGDGVGDDGLLTFIERLLANLRSLRNFDNHQRRLHINRLN